MLSKWAVNQYISLMNWYCLNKSQEENSAAKSLCWQRVLNLWPSIPHLLWFAAVPSSQDLTIFTAPHSWVQDSNVKWFYVCLSDYLFVCVLSVLFICIRQVSFNFFIRLDSLVFVPASKPWWHFGDFNVKKLKKTTRSKKINVDFVNVRHLWILNFLLNT